MTGNYEREQNEPEIVMVNGKEVARQRVECYSRVTGYLRPVSQWNDAKVAEFNNRKTFQEKVSNLEKQQDQIIKQLNK